MTKVKHIGGGYHTVTHQGHTVVIDGKRAWDRAAAYSLARRIDATTATGRVAEYEGEEAEYLTEHEAIAVQG